MDLLQSLSNDDKLALMETADVITVDTEGLATMLGYSVCFDGLQSGFYLGYNHVKDNLSKSQQKRAFEILSSASALVFHNALHDLRVLARHGLDYRGEFFDTMLMAHWINEERISYKLDDICKVYGLQGKSMPKSMSMIIEMDGWDSVPIDMMTDYSGNDALIEHRLFRKLLPEFEAQGFLEPWKVEQEFIRDSMIPMIATGVKIDSAFCIREIMKGNSIMEAAKKDLGINPGSTKDLEQLLIKELELPVVRTTPKGKPSFNKDAMAEYEILLENKDDKRASRILEFRGWQKTVSANYKAYLSHIDDQGVLHPNYMLHRTVTGRLACSEPALQQIPKDSDKEWNGKSKSAFIAREGYKLWTVDYSQLQFRMACSYANEESLLDIFNDRSRDIFTEMAKQIGWLRSDVKTLVYLILFGGGVGRAMAAFNVGESQAKELLNEFHSTYPGLKKVARKAQNAATAMGYVKYWTGRRRHFPKGSKYYRAFNACIQGGEAEIMKRAMVALNRDLCNDDCRIVMQIHDELAFEIREGLEDQYLPQIQKIMEKVPEEFCKFTGVHVIFPTDAKPWGQK